MNVFEKTKQIRKKLKVAWAPFFSRFGKLTEIQLATIPKVLSGKDVMVISPTATGKTEAIVAPVAEQLKAEKWNLLSVVYVVPTRALANDCLSRISGPLEDMGIKSALKHGDKPSFNKETTNWLITTPESLDSLLCRSTSFMSHLKCVILDEIHLLDNSYRGDQLRILLKRIQDANEYSRPKIHLLSATIPQPCEVASRYNNDCEIITEKRSREFASHYVSSAKSLFLLARKKKWRKILVFCNYRETAESLGEELSRLWGVYPVVVHHGSLSREERVNAEEIIHQSKVAVCVATSTLEVGIDIGNIDAVVLAEVPWSISSLMQRIGRSNRRGGYIEAVALLNDDSELNAYKEMFEIAQNNELEDVDYNADLSVAIQQIFSCLYQNVTGMEENELCSLLNTLASNTHIYKILETLKENSWIQNRSTRWQATTKLMDLGEIGRIHSNIPDSFQFEVIDSGSGRCVGKIFGSFDKTFTLGQKRWLIETIQENRIIVKRFQGTAMAPYFKKQKTKGAFFHLLPPELRT